MSNKATKMMYSATSINRCPYAIKKVFEQGSSSGPLAVMGTASHEVMAEFLEYCMENEEKPEDLPAFVASITNKYAKKLGASEVASVQKNMERFLEYYGIENIQSLAEVEVGIALDHDWKEIVWKDVYEHKKKKPGSKPHKDLTFSGTPDAVYVETDEDGNMYGLIVDWKNTRHVPSNSVLNDVDIYHTYRWQLCAYAWLVYTYSMSGLDLAYIKGRLYFTKYNTYREMVFSLEEIEQVGALIQERVNAVEAMEEYNRVPGSDCQYCDCLLDDCLKKIPDTLEKILPLLETDEDAGVALRDMMIASSASTMLTARLRKYVELSEKAVEYHGISYSIKEEETEFKDVSKIFGIIAEALPDIDPMRFFSFSWQDAKSLPTDVKNKISKEACSMIPGTRISIKGKKADLQAVADTLGIKYEPKDTVPMLQMAIATYKEDNDDK